MFGRESIPRTCLHGRMRTGQAELAQAELGQAELGQAVLLESIAALLCAG